MVTVSVPASGASSDRVDGSPMTVVYSTHTASPQQDGVDEPMLEDAVYSEGVTANDAVPAAMVQTSSSHEESAPGLELLGRGIKTLFDTFNSLRGLGVDDRVKQFPKIVVVGDQSAGKSSLVEALSEIKVPRNTGTCTRCPLEINLTEGTSDSPWTCEVSLLEKYVYTPEPAEDGKSAFKHFASLPKPNETPFEKVYRKDDLADVLKRAQAATLQPRVAHRPGASMRSSPARPLVVSDLIFSPNVVRLRISGPGAPNLSFYDLPGVINQTENMNDLHLVDLVKDLVREYVRNDDCLVLLAQEMNNDPNNSTAGGLIRNMQAADRCIGVLTKPDLIKYRQMWPLWRDVLNDAKFAVKHRYFVTKQPDQDMLDRGITHAEARALEQEFFATQEPWATEFACFRDRFGTRNLVETLAKKLADLYLKKLPVINAQLSASMERVERDLGALLPDPPSDGLPVILGRKLELMHGEIKQYFRADAGYQGLKTSYSAIARSFSAFIHQSRPDLNFAKRGRGVNQTPQKPDTPSGSFAARPDLGSPTPSRGRPDSIVIDDDDEEDPPKAVLHPKAFVKRAAESKPTTPSKKQRVGETANRQPQSSGFGSPKDAAREYTCQQIKNMLMQEQTNQLAGEPEQIVVPQLSRVSIYGWKAPVDLLLQKTRDIVGQWLGSVVDDIFAEYCGTSLPDRIKHVIDEVLKKAVRQAEHLAEEVLENEKYLQSTLDAEGLEAARRECMEALERRGQEQRINEYLDKTEPGNKTTEGSERRTKVNNLLEKNIMGEHPYRREIAVIAHVQGYYKIAANRLIDFIVLSFDRHLFSKQVADELEAEVEKLMGLKQPDVQMICAELTAEDPGRFKRREELKEERRTLEKALDRLKALAAA